MKKNFKKWKTCWAERIWEAVWKPWSWIREVYLSAYDRTGISYHIVNGTKYRVISKDVSMQHKDEIQYLLKLKCEIEFKI